MIATIQRPTCIRFLREDVSFLMQIHYFLTDNHLVVRTGFEPVDKKYIRCDLLLRLRNLTVTIPIPPPDYLQLWLMRPHEVYCPPSSVSISDKLNFKIRSCLTPKSMSVCFSDTYIYLSNHLIGVDEGFEPSSRGSLDVTQMWYLFPLTPIDSFLLPTLVFQGY